MILLGQLLLVVGSIFVFFGVVISTQETIFMFRYMLMENKNFRTIKNNIANVNPKDYRDSVLYARKALKSSINYLGVAISVCLVFWVLAVIIAKSIIAMY